MTEPITAKLKDALDELEEFIADDADAHFDSYEEWKAAYATARSGVESLFAESRIEIERLGEHLRASWEKQSLTPEEAQAAVTIIEQAINPDFLLPEERAALEKLRALADSLRRSA